MRLAGILEFCMGHRNIRIQPKKKFGQGGTEKFPYMELRLGCLLQTLGSWKYVGMHCRFQRILSIYIYIFIPNQINKQIQIRSIQQDAPGPLIDRGSLLFFVLLPSSAFILILPSILIYHTEFLICFLELLL